MADSRFFQKQSAFTVAQICDALGCTLAENADPKYLVHDVAPLKTATKNDLSFLDNAKYRADFQATKAGACIVSQEMAAIAPKGVICLITKSPYKIYARAAQMFYPDNFPKESVAATAFIHPTATLGRGCIVEHNVYIGPGVKIGDGCWLEVGSVIQENVEIGKRCRIGVNAVVSHALIGDGVRIYTGACVGQDGFGFAIDPAGHVKVPQLGRVIIGNHVEIGANTTIDRGAGPDTIIGDGTWIDNLVQIGHNVSIGRGCIIAGQVGISGSTIIGDFVAFGGQSGVAGHLKIGTGARIAAKSGITRNVPAGEEYMGYPAFPMRQYLRQVSALNALIKKKKND